MSAPTTAIGAVAALIGADAGYQALVPSGGPWTDEVPSEKTLPRVEIEHQSEKYVWTSEAQFLEQTKLKITAMAKATSTAGAANPTEAIAEAIKTVIEQTADLGITNAPTVLLRRSEWRFSQTKDKGIDGERVYKGELDLDCWLQRQRTRPA